MKESFYVLTYPKVAPTDSAYLWQQAYAGQYVQVNRECGGIPHPSFTVTGASQFTSFERMQDYRAHYPWLCAWRVDAEPVAVIPERSENI